VGEAVRFISYNFTAGVVYTSKIDAIDEFKTQTH